MTSQTDGIKTGIAVLRTHPGMDDTDRQSTARRSVGDEPPWFVNGVLIPENAVTQGKSGKTRLWPSSVLERAADRLVGRSLVKNFHELQGRAGADDVIGKITDAAYEEGVGIVFQGEIVDREIADKIAAGFLEVSPRVDIASETHDEANDRFIVESIGGFVDVAVVDEGAGKGNSIEIGENPSIGALSAEALSRAFQPSEALSVSTPSPDGYTSGSWPPGGASSVTLEGTFDGDLEAARRSATWVDGEGEDFTDLSLFILNAEGEANVNALDSAWTLASQTDGPSESDVAELRSFYESQAEAAREAGVLSESEFEETWADRTSDTESMSLDEAKQTVAEEYDLDVEELDELVIDNGEEPDGGDGPELGENEVEVTRGREVSVEYE